MINDDFRAADLDWAAWCPCQIDTAHAPLRFSADPDEPGDRIVAIVADEASLGGNVCRPKEPHFECRPPADTPAFTMFMSSMAVDVMEAGEDVVADEPAPLGPSFIRPPELLLLDHSLGLRTKQAQANIYCTEKVLRRVEAAGEENECIQRQELRPQGVHSHPMDEVHLYAIRFRMPRVIEDEFNSIRWVTAQWKHEPVSTAYAKEFGKDWGASPFLAQRFDNGVLHVTVQDEHCRCMVASAPLLNGSNLPWQDGRAQYCVSTRPEDPPNFACAADLHVEYGEDPVLSSPRGKWVEMRYRVEAGRLGNAAIEIHEGERFIVRVTGKIGYAVDAGQDSVVKFKFGQYRDYMPFVHAMDVDRVTVEPAE
ncbi:MAG TPA: hypothetical protein VH835_10280 [Dongiaceae bacterium]